MSKRSLLERVCGRLIDDLDSHKSITEEQVLAFMEALSVEEPGDLSDMPVGYRKLKFSMGEVWQYREWKELSPEQAFLYGGLWGSVKAYELKQQKKRNADQMKLLVSKYRDKDWIFRAIKSHPGILHKELAERGHISPSRLSQIMDDKDITSLISYRVSGREKYYFLRPQGEELLSKLKRNDRKILGSYAEPCKAISINNDSAEYVHDGMILFGAAINGNSVMPIITGLGYLNKMIDVVNSRFSTKNMVGVNEWIQRPNYMSIWEKSHSKNGSEMSLAR